MNRSAPESGQKGGDADPGPGRAGGKSQRQVTDGMNEPKDQGAASAKNEPGTGLSLGHDGGADPGAQCRGTPSDCTDTDDWFKEQVPAEADPKGQPVPPTFLPQERRPDDPGHGKQDSSGGGQGLWMTEQSLYRQGDGNQHDGLQAKFHGRSPSGFSARLPLLTSQTDWMVVGLATGRALISKNGPPLSWIDEILATGKPGGYIPSAPLVTSS